MIKAMILRGHAVNVFKKVVFRDGQEDDFSKTWSELHSSVQQAWLKLAEQASVTLT